MMNYLDRVFLKIIKIFGVDLGAYRAAYRHRSFDSMSGILKWLLDITKEQYCDFNIKGCDVLELGTGKFLTHAICLFVCGARGITTIDKFKLLDRRAVKKAMSAPIIARKILSSYVTHDEYMEKMKIICGTNYLLPKLRDIGINYVAPKDITDQDSLNKQFDFAMSYTVLEHIPESEIPAIIKRIVDAVKPGGICVHYVDLEDHFSPQQNPFGFLSSDEVFTEDASLSRGNRLRFSAWKSIFAELGDMEWSYPYVSIRHDAKLPHEINPIVRYVDEEDLRVSGFVVVGKKVN